MTSSPKIRPPISRIQCSAGSIAYDLPTACASLRRHRAKKHRDKHPSSIALQHMQPVTLDLRSALRRYRPQPCRQLQVVELLGTLLALFACGAGGP